MKKKQIIVFAIATVALIMVTMGFTYAFLSTSGTTTGEVQLSHGISIAYTGLSGSGSDLTVAINKSSLESGESANVGPITIKVSNSNYEGVYVRIKLSYRILNGSTWSSATPAQIVPSYFSTLPSFASGWYTHSDGWTYYGSAKTSTNLTTLSTSAVNVMSNNVITVSSSIDSSAPIDEIEIKFEIDAIQATTAAYNHFWNS